jgi:hypothetical protein
MAAKDPALSASRIANATRVAQAADDTPVTGWAVADKFIMAAQLDEQSGPWNGVTYKIQWRESGGTFGDLTATGEMKTTTATDLVNGNAVTSGEAICTNDPGGSWTDGWEVEGTGSASSLDLADEDYTELHFAIDPADSVGGTVYEFRIWDVTNGAEIGVCSATMTSVAAVNIALATATLTASGIALALVGDPNILLDIDHEIDLSEWDGTIGTPTRISAAAMGGTSWGMSIQVAGGTALFAYAAIDLTGKTQCRFRFYFDPNSYSIDSGGDTHEIATIRANIINAALRMECNYDATYGQAIRINLYSDGDVSNSSSYYDLTDGPHWIEVLITRATGAATNDGSAQFWVDDASQETVSGVDNYDAFVDMDELRLGIANANATTSGTIYFDEVIFRNDGTYIGPVSTGDTINLATAALTAGPRDRHDRPGHRIGQCQRPGYQRYTWGRECGPCHRPGDCGRPGDYRRCWRRGPDHHTAKHGQPGSKWPGVGRFTRRGHYCHEYRRSDRWRPGDHANAWGNCHGPGHGPIDRRWASPDPGPG